MSLRAKFRNSSEVMVAWEKNIATICKKEKVSQLLIGPLP